MELTGAQKFKAINDRHENIKNCKGEIMLPVACLTHNYEDSDGKLHCVLVILNGKDKKFYKTEVAAFIEKFKAYWESFGELPDEEKPEIVINPRISKKGNEYANFDLVDAD